MVLMKEQINNKYIDELFGIKILDNIKKYTKKKNTKPSICNFYYLGKHLEARGKRYSNDNMNFCGGKKPMKFIKEDTFLNACILHADKNSRITLIEAGQQYPPINKKFTTFKKILSKYKEPFDKNICKHFDLAKSEFITKYYKNDGDEKLVSSQYRFKINKTPIILSTEMRCFPEIKEVRSKFVLFNLYLSTEKIWKESLIKDCGFFEVNNLWNRLKSFI